MPANATHIKLGPVVSPRLNVPQAKFLSLTTKYRAYVAGYGAGKTWAGCSAQAKHFYEHPRVRAGYFAPTYPQIRDIYYPTVEEVFFDWGLTTKVRVGNHEVDVYRGKICMGTVMCRSMEDPGSIIGFKIGRALVDEIDVLSKDKATNAWRKILARMRHCAPGLVLGVDVTTTPEGFRFAYHQFVKHPRDNQSFARLCSLVRASTYDNEANLPEGYVEGLLVNYPENLIKAYINGEFVNLQTGTIYSSFSRVENNCTDEPEPSETLFVGMDFNVGHMAAIVHVKRGGHPRAVEEIVGGFDTPDMIRELQSRYQPDGGKTRQIRVYPDASGGSRKSTNASVTDLDLLRQAGFVVCAPSANPPVKDRINSMNAMFHNAAGERRYKINVAKCPTYAECLEQQAWGTAGEPDKSSGHDHANDAAGYFIHHNYPVTRPVASVHAI